MAETEYKADFLEFLDWAMENDWYEVGNVASSLHPGRTFYKFITPIGVVICVSVNKDGEVESVLPSCP